MGKIFKDPSMQIQFDRDGFVTVPLLSEAEAAELLAFYQSLQMQPLGGFHASMFQSDRGLKEAADAKIREFASEKVLDFLYDYRDLYANFMVKEPGEASAMKVHQDWTYVDESQHISLAVWFPLLDTTPKNGGLVFAKGTQNIFNPVRGPGVKDPYQKIADLLVNQYGTEVSLKAGEAVIWRHKVVHWSPPNLSDRARVAATIILVPEAAEVFHYFRNDKLPFDQVEKFTVDHEFFMDYNIMEGPSADRSLGVVDYHFDWLNKENLVESLAISGPVSKKENESKEAPKNGPSNKNDTGLFAKLRKIFS